MLPVGGGRGRGDKGTIGGARGRGSGRGQDPLTGGTTIVTVGGLSEEIARGAGQICGRGYRVGGGGASGRGNQSPKIDNSHKQVFEL